MSYLPTDYDEILKRQQEAVASKKAEREGTINTLYNSQKTVTQDEHNRLIDSIEKDYADEYQKNAVQKLINERQIAETNENLGLTDSGLNRTQQTAAQLSYANQKGKLDIAKQTRLDEQSAALASAIAQIENNRLAALDDNATYWQGVAADNAQAEYEANVKNNTAIDTALIKAAQKSAESQKATNIINNKNSLLSRNFSGKLSDNNIKVTYNREKGIVTYTDGVTGYSSDFPIGVNPYTGGDYHKDLLDKDGKYDSSKAFSNGYQPNNVNGNKLKKVPEAVVRVNGNEQSVWYGGGAYYIWNGAENKYESLTRAQLHTLGI